MNIVDKIINMPTFTDPWYHGYTDNFLPDDYYADLCSNIDNIKTGIKTEPGHAVSNQTIIDITKVTENIDFWVDFVAMFSTPEFLDAMQEISKIPGKFNELRYDIHRCEQGFGLHEHNDVKPWNQDMASLQIYCARDMSMSNEGTTLVGEQDKLIEYVPNRAWMFACGENTFHKVEPISGYRTSVLMKFGVNK